MSLLLIALLAILVGLIAAVGWGILRFHGSISKHHLRGRYTWADEIAALEAKDSPAFDQ